MENIIYRKIDALGRIVIPTDLRTKASWVPGDSITFTYDETTRSATIALHEKNAQPKCVLSDKSE